MKFKNQELQGLVDALENAKGTFQMKGKLNIWGGIVTTLAKVYPAESKAIAEAFGSASSIKPSTARKYKTKTVDVSPDSQGHDPFCANCGANDTNYDTTVEAKNEGSDDLDEDDPMNESEEIDDSPVSLSTAQTKMDVENYFGGDIEKAKEFLKSRNVVIKSNWKESTIWNRILNDVLNAY